HSPWTISNVWYPSVTLLRRPANWVVAEGTHKEKRMDMPVVSAPKRRTILTGAAWSTPVIAAAIAAPSASASEVPSGADYHWGATNMILDGASGELRATYSTTISFSGQTPPNNATMTLLVTFDKDVTITSET